jgi:SAM-dependent methyltransferase
MMGYDPPERSARAKDFVRNSDGIFVPPAPINHRDEEYDRKGFDALWQMQIRHFWYRGRHRFLFHATERALTDLSALRAPLAVIDLGGGCGGWTRYLLERKPSAVSEIALADSSLEALSRAGALLPAVVNRYQVDLLDLPWRERWDGVFLLDVLEHLPDDVAAVREVAQALKPGGLLFVTMPALQCFWSYNDEIARHCRRYDRESLGRLAEAAGLHVLSVRYFMFFLSPLLWISRSKPGIATLSTQQKLDLAGRAHRVPFALLNEPLAAVFGAETPLGHWIQFPWGTSIFGLFQKPIAS